LFYMNPIWQAYLQDHGATIEDDRVVHHGNSCAELASAQSATVIADLSHLGLVQFSGEDAQSFLQGQLTCDVRQVDFSSALYGGYCNPKGRMLASFLLYHDNSGYLMQLPLELQPAIQKRLSMYVLRAKVKVTDRSEALVRIGVAGNNAGALIETVSSEIPTRDLGVTHGTGGVSIIRLAQDRFELLLTVGLAPEIWQCLSKDAVAVGAPVWDWLEIRAGIPRITAATQEQFVPQMVNLEMIGGVSFQKGCYPGQEIVARSKYLGKIKRRMYLAHVEPQSDEGAVRAGDELFDVDMGEQSSGMVVNAAASPEGGFDMLAVLQTSSVERGSIRWGRMDGPTLGIMTLPYSVPHFENQ
jgi:folate-binding protein YgfZ